MQHFVKFAEVYIPRLFSKLFTHPAGRLSHIHEVKHNPC